MIVSGFYVEDEADGTACCLLGAIKTKFWLEASRRISDSTLNWLPLIKRLKQLCLRGLRIEERRVKMAGEGGAAGPADNAHEVDSKHAAEFAAAAGGSIT